MFSIDRRYNPNQGAKLKDAGPYEARITSHLDGKYMGTLEVELLRSNDSGMDSLEPNQRVQVQYLNPFYGVTNYNGVTSNNDYASSQQSYGMWFIPPDIGNIVLVIFVEGNLNKGYWFGCVQAENQNFMIPDGRPATTFTDITGNIADIGKKMPVGEYNKELLINTLNLTDATKNLKPINTEFKNILQNQGLLQDEIRGLTTTSARREAPSSVFGVSTPGPLDKRGNARGKGGRYHSRLGGSSIVMDDGDAKFLRKTSASKGPSEYVNKTLDFVTTAEETIPHNELVRIRTRTGHQILLHNSEDLIYIGNAAGTTWIEMTANGKIDVYAKDSISFHTEADFNFKADRDVNIEADRNVNIKSQSSVNIESVSNFNLYSGINVQVDSAGLIHLSNNLATPISTHAINGTNSIMKRIPQHEPWLQHENLNPNNVNSSVTDRENSAVVNNSTQSQINDTFAKN